MRPTAELPAPLVSDDHSKFLSPERLRMMEIHKTPRTEAPIERGNLLLAEATKSNRVEEIKEVASSGQFTADEIAYVAQALPRAIKQFCKLLGTTFKPKPAATRKLFRPRQRQNQMGQQTISSHNCSSAEQINEQLIAKIEEIRREFADRVSVLEAEMAQSQNLREVQPAIFFSVADLTADPWLGDNPITVSGRPQDSVTTNIPLPI